MRKSDRFQLIEERLGQPLEGYLRQVRGADPPTPYHVIASALSDETGVSVTYEAVRTWYQHIIAEDVTEGDQEP